MAIPILASDTRDIRAAVLDLYRPSSFILDLFFPDVMEFDTQYVMWDEVVDGRELAAFSAPDVKATRTQPAGNSTKSTFAPYIKLDTPVKPGRALKRRAGEALGGELSPDERMTALALQDLAGQERAILRRHEWMACQLLDGGSFSMTGEGYDGTVTFDFGRAAGHNIALTGADRWGESGVNISDEIEDYAEIVGAESGVYPNIAIVDGEAAKLLRNDTKIREALDNTRGMGPTSGLELGPLNPDDVSHAAYLGTIGSLEFWKYSQVYEQGGSRQKFMPANTLWLGSRALEGVRAYGAIQTVDSMQPADFFQRVYPERNPDAMIAETQSACLPVPLRKNASMRVRVR